MKEKILDILRCAADYISGEELSRRLGVSRAAIWKHIKRLKEAGYEIDSVTNRGYRLTSTPDTVSAEKIAAKLNTKYIGQNMHCLSETDSTNNEAKRHSCEVEGTLFITEMQTAGKGRLGRAWESPRGTGIWMSLLLKPDTELAEVPEITLIAGIAVCRAVGHGARIKWPNDIVIGSRKICGILTEMSAEIEHINYVVCGIGINVNIEEFPTELQDKATSLLIETGEKLPRADIIAAVMNEFEPLYEVFKKDGFAPLRDEYSRLCVTIGREVRVIYRNKTVIGTAADVTPSGGLVVTTASGTVTVTSGEVSVRGIYGYI